MHIFIFFFVKQRMESRAPVLFFPTPSIMASSFFLRCCRGFPFRFTEPFPLGGFVSSLLLFHMLLWRSATYTNL